MIKSDLVNIKRNAYCKSKSEAGNSSAPHSPWYQQHQRPHSVTQQQPCQQPPLRAGSYSSAVTPAGQLVNLIGLVGFFFFSSLKRALPSPLPKAEHKLLLNHILLNTSLFFSRKFHSLPEDDVGRK